MVSINLAEDSRVLASASKRDSSSMKTLAAVTVVFLPSTFMASLFATPLFNWDAGPGETVVIARFWIYWAVTVPLTLVTIASWLLWTHRQALLHREQDLEARDELRRDIAGKLPREHDKKKIA
jgi:hypothetical protein